MGQQPSTSNTRNYPLPGGALAERDGTGLYYLATDQLGTPIASLRLDDGVLTGTQLRTPYGQARYSSASASNGGMHSSFGFTGQREDSQAAGSSGLTYFNARYYDPLVGRFTSADDVVGSDPFLDAYAYVGGMVESATDPSGRLMDLREPGGGGDGGDAIAVTYVTASAASGDLDLAGAFLAIAGIADEFATRGLATTTSAKYGAGYDPSLEDDTQETQNEVRALKLATHTAYAPPGPPPPPPPPPTHQPSDGGDRPNGPLGGDNNGTNGGNGGGGGRNNGPCGCGTIQLPDRNDVPVYFHRTHGNRELRLKVEDVMQDILQNRRLRGAQGAHGEGVWAYQLGPGRAAMGAASWPKNPLAANEVLFTTATNTPFQAKGQLGGEWGGSNWNAKEGRFLIGSGEYLSIRVIAGPGDCWTP